jgi:hypothetical protein
MSEVLVLRTIYMDRSKDEILREIAYHYKISKGTLIRILVNYGIENIKEALPDEEQED